MGSRKAKTWSPRIGNSPLELLVRNSSISEQQLMARVFSFFCTPPLPPSPPHSFTTTTNPCFLLFLLSLCPLSLILPHTLSLQKNKVRTLNSWTDLALGRTVKQVNIVYNFYGHFQFFVLSVHPSPSSTSYSLCY